jgi:hypothetical protein
VAGAAQGRCLGKDKVQEAHQRALGRLWMLVSQSDICVVGIPSGDGVLSPGLPLCMGRTHACMNPLTWVGPMCVWTP